VACVVSQERTRLAPEEPEEGHLHVRIWGEGAGEPVPLPGRRRPPASARTSLPLPGAPERRRWAALWRHSGVEDKSHLGVTTGAVPWGPCLPRPVTASILPTRSTARDRSCCCCMGSAMTGASGANTGGSSTCNRRLRSLPWIYAAVVTATLRSPLTPIKWSSIWLMSTRS